LAALAVAALAVAAVVVVAVLPGTSSRIDDAE
jgi:hypothetical protein